MSWELLNKSLLIKIALYKNLISIMKKYYKVI